LNRIEVGPEGAMVTAFSNNGHVLASKCTYSSNVVMLICIRQLPPEHLSTMVLDCQQVKILVAFQFLNN
jgi:hypothetical protein